MFNRLPSHSKAVIEALAVTFLWSTSWVLIKVGLKDIPALTFAGLRYGLAFLCLLPVVLRPAHRAAVRRLAIHQWGNLILLGLLFYAATQGAQFLGLAYLPAATVSLLLNLTTVLVALLGIVLQTERLTGLQWAGVILSVIGTLAYFYPVALPTGQWLGIVIVTLGVLANALSSILGRRVNQDKDMPAIIVTAISMGIGAGILLPCGVAIQGMPAMQPSHWLIVGWLAVVNTSIAFTLWNHSLQTLTATESSILNSTMLIQIAILAWVFLKEPLTVKQIIGMALAGSGALLVQRCGEPPRRKPVADGHISPA